MSWSPKRPSAQARGASVATGSEVGPIDALAAISVGPVVLDGRSRRVFINGWGVLLPAQEVALLMVLMRNPGRVLTVAELARAGGLDRTDPARAARRTRQLVRRLRRRLIVHPLTPVLVERIGTVGFRFSLIE